MKESEGTEEGEREVGRGWEGGGEEVAVESAQRTDSVGL